ncbi:uncharacterized protein STAUR_0692 [Stigmatella aurantiaca DW4/3-1]|uniref:Uncharacterized protein n=1 Tax=Stigmatella aurantiaca (strain DW4/3-1) TaxID=378806 RepID=E3FWI3_STIAD|nr:uncharacterized protein STAUR_0692 [Stigmatella aurantiaca DW4/3-1]
MSDDGREWTPLNQDGTFVVLATDLYGLDFSQQNPFIHIWDSRGLTSFENYRRVERCATKASACASIPSAPHPRRRTGRTRRSP